VPRLERKLVLLVPEHVLVPKFVLPVLELVLELEPRLGRVPVPVPVPELVPVLVPVLELAYVHLYVLVSVALLEQWAVGEWELTMGELWVAALG